MPLQKLSGPSDFGEYTQRSKVEAGLDGDLRTLWQEMLPALGSRAWQWDQLVLLKRQVLSRLLHFDRLYQLMLPTQGCILELGVQWGAGLATLLNLRGIYEPFNYARRIVGFDTFTGFVEIGAEDGGRHQEGDCGVPAGWAVNLERILSLHEANSPLGHIQKFELVEGDVCETLPTWLSENPGALVSMAIFDVDLYKPTRIGLEMLLPRMPRGAVIVFDEANCPHFPGETSALLEVMDINRLRLQSNPHQPFCSWAVIE